MPPKGWRKIKNTSPTAPKIDPVEVAKALGGELVAKVEASPGLLGALQTAANVPVPEFIDQTKLLWGIDIPTLSVYPIIKVIKEHSGTYKFIHAFNNIVKWGDPKPTDTSKFTDLVHKDLVFTSREKALEELDRLIGLSIKLLGKHD